MEYIKVVINGEIIPGEDISMVFLPTETRPQWTISMKNNTVINATGQVSVWERKK